MDDQEQQPDKQVNKNVVTRRSFLRGLGIAAATAVGLASTMGVKNVRGAIEDARSQMEEVSGIEKMKTEYYRIRRLFRYTSDVTTGKWVLIPHTLFSENEGAQEYLDKHGLVDKDVYALQFETDTPQIKIVLDADLPNAGQNDQGIPENESLISISKTKPPEYRLNSFLTTPNPLIEEVSLERVNFYSRQLGEKIANPTGKISA